MVALVETRRSMSEIAGLQLDGERPIPFDGRGYDPYA